MSMPRSACTLAAAATFLLVACGGDDDRGGDSAATAPSYRDTTLSADRRAELLVAAMTLDEKIEQISMRTGPNPDLPNCGVRSDSRHLEGIPPLGIPTYRATNGPTGVGGGDCAPDAPATGVPTALGVAASWDPAMSYLWGDIAGSEVRANGYHAFYAPGVNLARVPQAGRNYEYFGEDPLLTGAMAVQQIKAVQSHGVHAVAKHYVANEQETQRTAMNVVVDGRTLRELYLLPFAMGIAEADVAALMCSYPRVNGIFSCENTALYDILHKELGFTGYVTSDRGATKSTAASIKAGLSLELISTFATTPPQFTPELIDAALAANQITAADIDAILKQRYRVMFASGQYDQPIFGTTPIDFAGHGQAARRIASQGAVLLKNQGSLLPLTASALTKIAVIGPKSLSAAALVPTTGPTGQVKVTTTYTVTPAEGLQAALTAAGSAASVTVDDGTDLARAGALAAASDVAILMVGDLSIEGVDRPDLALPVRDGVDQNALVAAVAAANPRTVVVLKNSGAVLMPWLGQVPSVLAVWQPGQEDGNVVADLLFGKVNPSGKLPLTFPAQEREGGASTVAQWPGVAVDGILTATYAEKLAIGYRWYQAHGVQPLFPFGFGLSYTSFGYGPMRVDASQVDGRTPISVKFTLANTGAVAGAEVAQVYASFPSAYGEPPTRLVGFQKVFLNPGQTASVTIVIDPAASNHPLSYWDDNAKAWTLMEGAVQLQLARSSTAVESTVNLEVAKPT